MVAKSVSPMLTGVAEESPRVLEAEDRVEREMESAANAAAWAADVMRRRF
jgi:hypothetical protein